MACQLRPQFAVSQARKAADASSARPVAARCKTVVRCQGPSQSRVPAVSRREIVAIAAMAPAFLTLKANALIDFEEDDELLARVRADRAGRAQKERISEEIYVKEAGFSNKKFDRELVPVQKTVKRLSKSGALIEAGDSEGLKSFISSQGDFVAELKTASQTLSVTSAARSEADVVDASLKAFVGDAIAKSSNTKTSYLKAVSAFETWCITSTVASAITGL